MFQSKIYSETLFLHNSLISYVSKISTTQGSDAGVEGNGHYFRTREAREAPVSFCPLSSFNEGNRKDESSLTRNDI